MDDARQAAPCSAPGHLLASGVSFEALVWGRQGGALSARARGRPWRGRASQWRARKWTGASSSGFEGVLGWGATGMLEGPWQGFVGGSVSCSVVCGRGLGGVQAGPVRGRSQAGRQASLISRPELGSPSPDPGWGRPDWCQHVRGFAAGISRGPCDTAPGDPGLPATFTVGDCGWGRWGAARQGVECGCLSCCVGWTCGPFLRPRLGGRWPPPPLLRDNGGRGPGLSKAQASGNVSVLRAPGAGSMGGLGC